MVWYDSNQKTVCPVYYNNSPAANYNVKGVRMDNDRILVILANEIPDFCPNCKNKELYGGYAIDYDVGVVICRECNCIVLVKEEL